MPTREEIREGIAQLVIAVGKPNKRSYAVADGMLRYLHSQGVVIKVDRELPTMPPVTDEELKARHDGKCQFIRQGEYFNTLFCGLTGESARTMRFCKRWSDLCNPKDCIKEYRDGYVAVKPLIKEVSNGR